MSLINIPAHEYHAHPALGSTSLKRALITPSHYWGFSKLNPDRFVDEETDALRFGRLAHCMVLEDAEVLKRDFIILPNGLNRQTKVGKAQYAEIMATAGNRTVVKQDDVDVALAMRKVVSQHFVWKYLQHGASEGSIFWTENGIKCKVRLDWLEGTDVGDIIIDYKTAQCADIDKFSRQISNLNYHVQVAHYMAGYRAAFGREAGAFIFIAQDKKPPYAVGAYMVDPQAIFNGQVRRRKALQIIQQGHATGYWPGYTDKIEVIDLPQYAQYQAAQEAEDELGTDE